MVGTLVDEFLHLIEGWQTSCPYSRSNIELAAVDVARSVIGGIVGRLQTGRVTIACQYADIGHLLSTHIAGGPLGRESEVNIFELHIACGEALGFTVGITCAEVDIGYIIIGGVGQKARQVILETRRRKCAYTNVVAHLDEIRVSADSETAGEARYIACIRCCTTEACLGTCDILGVFGDDACIKGGKLFGVAVVGQTSLQSDVGAITVGHARLKARKGGRDDTTLAVGAHYAGACLGIGIALDEIGSHREGTCGLAFKTIDRAVAGGSHCSHVSIAGDHAALDDGLGFDGVVVIIVACCESEWEGSQQHKAQIIFCFHFRFLLLEGYLGALTSKLGVR